MTLTDFGILIVTLFTWSLKVRFSSNVTPRNLTETFVRIEFSNCNAVECVFLVFGDYHI